MRIEPQKTVLNHQTWEFNYIPNTKIEPWMNQDLFTIKKLAFNNFLHGDWDEFSPTKRTWILGQHFRSPTTWPPKWWHFLRPIFFWDGWWSASHRSTVSSLKMFETAGYCRVAAENGLVTSASCWSLGAGDPTVYKDKLSGHIVEKPDPKWSKSEFQDVQVFFFGIFR